MIRSTTLCFLIVSLLAAPRAMAEFDYSDRSRTGSMALDASLGFTLDPDLFLLGLEGDYFVTQHFAFGPLLQLGIDDNAFLLAPSLNFKGVFDLPTSNRALRRVKPFIQGGPGFAYINVDRGGRFGGDEDDVSLLLNLGFGTDIYLTTHVSLGTSILFNITPNDIEGEKLFFSWQFITARYHF